MPISGSTAMMRAAPRPSQVLACPQFIDLVSLNILRGRIPFSIYVEYALLAFLGNIWRETQTSRKMKCGLKCRPGGARAAPLDAEHGLQTGMV